MPAAARKGDRCTGHADYPPRASLSGSGDVFINGRGALRAGDSWAVHCNDDHCHSGSQSAGSGSVFVNGRALARVGDSVGCGSAVSSGSSDVFAG